MPPMSNLKTISSPLHPIFDSQRYSTATYLAQYVLTINSMTVKVMPTMGYTTFFLHSTLPMAQILHLSSHGIAHLSHQYHNAPLPTHSHMKSLARIATSPLTKAMATTTYYISLPYTKKSTKKESLSSSLFTTAMHLSPIPKIVPLCLPRSCMVQVICSHKPTIKELQCHNSSIHTHMTRHYTTTNQHQSSAPLATSQIDGTSHLFQHAAPCVLKRATLPVFDAWYVCNAPCPQTSLCLVDCARDRHSLHHTVLLLST